MKRISIIFIIIWLLGSGWCLAETPADNQIKNALIDIAKYEQQFAGKTSVNPSTVKRSLKLLKITRQRLDSSPNKTHPSWINADNRYKALVANLNNYLSPNKSAGSLPTQVKQNNTQTTTGEAPPKMISQYRVRIKKLARDIESRTQTLNQGGPKPFQDSGYVLKFQQSADRFKAAINKYSAYKGDADVVTATRKLTEFENMIAFGKQHAAKELAALGNVQARLKLINQQILGLKQPPTPREPYQEGELEQYVRTLASVRQAAVKTYKPLPEIKQRAYLPDNRLTVEQGGAYDLKDVDRMERNLINLIQSIDNDFKSFKDHLRQVVSRVEEDLAFYGTFDPADPNDQAKHFLTKGRADEIRSALTRKKQTASEAAVFAKLIKDDTYQKRLAIVKQVQATMDQYESNYQKALRLVRMPKAATTDSKLIKIARTTLANYDYVGPIKRLVINTKKVHRSKETSESKYDDVDVSLSGTITLSGTKTTYFYEWDEFQVATAEPMEGRFYIFYSTLKYFTSGASTTPLEKWIISGRIQSVEIPENNIQE